MRSPKEFRVYHSEHGMFEVAALDGSDDVVVALEREQGSHVEHQWYGGEVEVMQSIGLDDAEGTRIYEGDVLEVTLEQAEEVSSLDETRGAVQYDASAARFGIRMGSQLVGFDQIQECEVMGNLHETPDLLG